MRDDLSNKLVHLTKGIGPDLTKHREEAFLILCAILEQKRLVGGNGFIRGGHKCVCFSEAPISKLSHLLAAKDEGKFKYQPYGILLDKVDFYSEGGRPVIYGPYSEYYELPEQMRYRHVRMWLSESFSIDHTWEREWRHKVDYFPIDPSKVTIVVPDRLAKDTLDNAYKEDHWHFIVLSDLGVKVDSL